MGPHPIWDFFNMTFTVEKTGFEDIRFIMLPFFFIEILLNINQTM